MSEWTFKGRSELFIKSEMQRESGGLYVRLSIRPLGRGEGRREIRWETVDDKIAISDARIWMKRVIIATSHLEGRMTSLKCFHSSTCCAGQIGY
jgi:hypothetical protein